MRTWIKNSAKLAAVTAGFLAFGAGISSAAALPAGPDLAGTVGGAVAPAAVAVAGAQSSLPVDLPVDPMVTVGQAAAPAFTLIGSVDTSAVHTLPVPGFVHTMPATAVHDSGAAGGLTDVLGGALPAELGGAADAVSAPVDTARGAAGQATDAVDVDDVAVHVEDVVGNAPVDTGVAEGAVEQVTETAGGAAGLDAVEDLAEGAEALPEVDTDLVAGVTESAPALGGLTD
ncbi:hypothetical protein [Allonocardiopsis opalescens]|uniref:GLTT repeat-containing protein n=1 Tax=Allonocardiopsis opalescens TaxID=1144618 RepID=A0A2T0PSG8_9ACTN|nr:hypothetical protein [Allonocardiopsis opalescens]PRX91839.1 hypothetical protein CLV72_11324 [Allonocardiopsis opalescens]